MQRAASKNHFFIDVNCLNRRALSNGGEHLNLTYPWWQGALPGPHKTIQVKYLLSRQVQVFAKQEAEVTRRI